ncbi:hypothetical protein EV421DRAFT_1745325 [Armillaria borealis]|uniref:Uncharacterized protein n=1 Tax=Armillaria borealis TaxID=47425 RepID=A0AA39MDK8_9AGAR|nr:hypothetical protein EV421DRAFT_1745325 [Armillaria borealis]
MEQSNTNNQGHITAHQATDPTTTSSISTTQTPDMMPLLGAKTAPAKFREKYNTIKRDKCHQIIDYCSLKVTWFIEALDSFVNEDWDQLEKDILTYHNVELHKSHYLLNSESDNKHQKSCKKKGTKHCKQLSKTKKEKHTSQKKVDNDKTSINEQIEKGHIRKDEYGQLIHKDDMTTMSSNLVTINMVKADLESESDEEAYVDYFQRDNEIDLDEGYNDNAYIYTDQASVNAVTQETSEIQFHVKD